MKPSTPPNHRHSGRRRGDKPSIDNNNSDTKENAGNNSPPRKTNNMGKTNSRRRSTRQRGDKGLDDLAVGDIVELDRPHFGRTATIKKKVGDRHWLVSFSHNLATAGSRLQLPPDNVMGEECFRKKVDREAFTPAPADEDGPSFKNNVGQESTTSSRRGTADAATTTSTKTPSPSNEAEINEDDSESFFKFNEPVYNEKDNNYLSAVGANENGGKYAGTLKLLDKMIINDKPVITSEQPKQPTENERRAFPFPDHKTVADAKEDAKENRPDLYNRIGKGHLVDPKHTAVYYKNERNELVFLDAFAVLRGQDKKNDNEPVPGSLFDALGRSGGSLEQRLPMMQTNNIHIKVLDSYDEYIKLKVQVTDEKRAKLNELVMKMNKKVGNWNKKGDNTTYQQNASMNKRSHRDAYEIYQVFEFYPEEGRPGIEVLAKYMNSTEMTKSIASKQNRGIGGSWSKAGFQGTKFPTDRMKDGLIWKNVFFVKTRQLSTDPDIFDEEYAAIEVNSKRFLELASLFHSGKCEEGCNCPSSYVAEPYMHKSEQQDFVTKMNEELAKELLSMV